MEKYYFVEDPCFLLHHVIFGQTYIDNGYVVMLAMVAVGRGANFGTFGASIAKHPVPTSLIHHARCPADNDCSNRERIDSSRLSPGLIH